MIKIAPFIAATLALASAGLTTAAEAGGCGNRGFRGFSHGPSFSHRYQSSSYGYNNARKEARAAAKAAAAKRAEHTEARRETAAERRLAARLATQKEQVETVEETAALTPPAPQEKSETTADAKHGTTQVAEVRELNCKRYIPSVGLTITVPCK